MIPRPVAIHAPDCDTKRRTFCRPCGALSCACGAVDPCTCGEAPQPPKKKLGTLFWHQHAFGLPTLYNVCRWCRRPRVRVNGAVFCPSCDKVPA